MVKSKSNKMHLKVNNDLELDFNNASISKRNRKSKKSPSSPIKKKRPVSAKPKKLANKKRQSKRMTSKRGSALKPKQLMPSILINGKRVPAKALKMSSGPNFKEVAMFSASRKNASRSRRGTSNSRRKASTSRREASSSRRKASASRRNVSESRRKASASRRKVSDSRRKGSESRRRASVSRRRASDSRRKASDTRRRASDARRRASNSRRRASDARRRASDARRKASGRHSMKSKALPFVMSSIGKKEAFASSSRKKTPKMSTQNSGFSLKIKAKKMTSSGADKKSRSIRKRVKFAKKGTNGGDKSQTIYMPIQQASDGKSAEAIVVKKEEIANANKVDVKNVKIVEK